jgi:hypothetical protein
MFRMFMTLLICDKIRAETETNILGDNAKTIKIREKAYCDEMRIFRYFWYIRMNMEGIGHLAYAPTLKAQAIRS